MEFRQLRYAIAVARRRSFTKAALQLNISQSAISEQIKSLEAEVGFLLFRRTGQGVELTERGRIFLNEADRITSELRNLAALTRRLKGGPTESFVLGMISGVTQMFVPALFSGLAEVSKDARIDIIMAPTRSIFDYLHDERIDAGIAIESDPDRVPAGLAFERLAVAPMKVITRPNHPLARTRKRVDIGLLATEPIVMNELSVGYGEMVLSLFTDLGISPNILSVADNIETIKVAVQSGRGIAILPESCVENECALGTLKALDMVQQCHVAINLFWRRKPMTRQKDAYLAALRHTLKSWSK